MALDPEGGPNGAGGEMPSDDGRPEELHPRDYLQVLWRRWWIVALALVSALAVAWRNYQQQVPVYSAEALIQTQTRGSELVEFVPGQSGGAVQDLAADLEILRSRSRLTLVVDSLGLRLTLSSPTYLRSQVIAHAVVSPSAPLAAYTLMRRGSNVELRATGSNSLVATAPAGEWLAGPGFTVLTTTTVPASGPIGLAVVHPLDAASQLRAGLRVETVPGTNLIRIRYSSRDPQLAAAVPNLVASIYRDMRALHAHEAARRRVEFIAGQLSQLADSVEAADLALMRYEQEAGLFSPTEQAGTMAAGVAAADRKLREISFRERLLESLALSLRQDRADPAAFQSLALRASELLSGAGQDTYRRLQDLRAERMRLTASRIGYTGQGPSVEVIDSLIAGARADLRLAVEQALEELRTEKTEANEERSRLSTEAHAFPRERMEHARLERQVTTIQGQFTSLLGQYHEARIAEAAEMDDVEVIDPAPVPRSPDPRSTSPFILAILAGLGLGGAGAFGLERLDTTVRRPEDAERAAGLYVLGLIPELPVHGNGSGRPVVMVDESGMPGAEAFRMLRTTLSFVRAEAPRVIAVASTGPSEGKSIVAANLAAAFAQQGARALLVDADFRRPAVHTIFGVDQSPGLSDVLVGQTGLTDAVRRNMLPGLDVITCGTKAPNPAELLGSSAFEGFLRGAREHYDAVVIDTPPALAVTDAAIVGTRSEGVLLVTQANHTDRRALAAAANHFRQIRAPLLGVVVNRVSASARYGYYGYYHPYFGHDGGPHHRAWRAVRRVLEKARARLP